MKRKIAKALCLIFILAALSGCNNNGETVNYESATDMYFTDSEPTGFIPYKINIVDGSVYIPCPDPLCPHTTDTQTCPFSKCAATLVTDGGRYMFYSAKRYADMTDIINCYDTKENKTELVYECKTGMPNYLIYGNGRLYFDLPQVKEVDGVIIRGVRRDVMCYDPVSKQISRYGEMDEHDWLICAEDGYLVYRTASESIACKTTGSFDGSDVISLPEGHEYSPFDYWCIGKGFTARCYSPASIYLYDEKRLLDMPKQLDGKTIMVVTRTGDNFYFNLSGAESDGGFYENTVYIAGKDGRSSAFTVKSKYNFYTLKGYEHYIIGSVLNKCDNGIELDENDFDKAFIRIDLHTGSASVYTFSSSVGSGIVSEEITVSVTEEKQ